MANYLDKWKTDFPETINNQTRPAAGLDNTLEFNTDGFPQRITGTRSMRSWKTTLAASSSRMTNG